MTQITGVLGDVDPDRVFKDLAVQYRLLPDHGESVGDELWGYTMAVVTLCAKIADAHDNTQSGGSPGDSIRTALLDYRIR